MHEISKVSRLTDAWDAILETVEWRRAKCNVVYS
jgi:hypothetical protein